jgi:nitrate reductase gamma subunit
VSGNFPCRFYLPLCEQRIHGLFHFVSVFRGKEIVLGKSAFSLGFIRFVLWSPYSLLVSKSCTCVEWTACEILLVARRMTSKRVQMVTSKMDVVVFLVLLTQIISGLFVAYYSRWGSSWFAAFLSPYLRSIFVFDPQIDAISSVNSLALKVHVISAFSLIGLIPFTRFIHFLVYPVDYLWRSYQQVIWNWDRKNIRTSRFWKRGVPSKNN